MLFLSSEADGQIPSVSPPLEFIFFRYRKEMGLSWNEFLETPLSVVMQDLEFFSLEGKIYNAKLKTRSKRGTMR